MDEYEDDLAQLQRELKDSFGHEGAPVLSEAEEVSLRRQAERRHASVAFSCDEMRRVFATLDLAREKVDNAQE